MLRLNSRPALRVVRKRLRLAFLAPDITAGILSGHQPSLILAKLYETGPFCWAEQRHALNFNVAACFLVSLLGFLRQSVGRIFAAPTKIMRAPDIRSSHLADIARTFAMGSFSTNRILA